MNYKNKRSHKKQKKYYFNDWEFANGFGNVPSYINGKKVHHWKPVGQSRDHLGNVSDDDDATTPYIPIFDRHRSLFLKPLRKWFSRQLYNISHVLH